MSGLFLQLGAEKKLKKNEKNLFMCKLSFNFCAFQRLKGVTQDEYLRQTHCCRPRRRVYSKFGVLQEISGLGCGAKRPGEGRRVTGIAPVSSSLTPPTLKLREPEAFQACSPALKLTGILIIIIMKLMEVEGGLDRRALGPGGGA